MKFGYHTWEEEMPSHLALTRIPKEVADAIEGGGTDLPSWAIKGILVEGVRNGKISRGLLRKVLELSFDDAEKLLYERGVMYEVSPDELATELDLVLSRDGKSS